MYFLIRKATLVVVNKWPTVPGRIRIPGTGDVVFSPKAPGNIGFDYVLRKATVTGYEPFDDATEIRTGPLVVVDVDFSVTETYTVRTKTVQEFTDELAVRQQAAEDFYNTPQISALIGAIEDNVPGATGKIKAAAKAKIT